MRYNILAVLYLISVFLEVGQHSKLYDFLYIKCNAFIDIEVGVFVCKAWEVILFQCPMF